MLIACEDGQEERHPAFAASPCLAKRLTAPWSALAIGMAPGLRCADGGLPMGEDRSELICGTCTMARQNLELAIANDFLSKMGPRHPLSPMSQRALSNSLSSSLSSSPSGSTSTSRDGRRRDAEPEASYNCSHDHNQSVDRFESSVWKPPAVPERIRRNDSQVRLRDHPLSCCGAEVIVAPAPSSCELPLFTQTRTETSGKSPDSVVCAELLRLLVGKSEQSADDAEASPPSSPKFRRPSRCHGSAADGDPLDESLAGARAGRDGEERNNNKL